MDHYKNNIFSKKTKFIALKNILLGLTIAVIVFTFSLTFKKIQASNNTMSGSITIENQNPDPNYVTLLPSTLSISINGAVEMRFGNTVEERDGTKWEPYATEKKWNLKTGPGEKTVYGEFRNSKGNIFLTEAHILPDQSASYLHNTFNGGDEGWWIYNYVGETQGYNVFYPISWTKSGGINNSGYIWAGDSRWKIDTPEEPDSILSFITYRDWIGGAPLDLRDAEISFYLRGEQLDLKGASVYFWIFDNESGSRWHYTAYPLPVTNGLWGEKITFHIVDEENLWLKSWQRNNPLIEGTLQNSLPHADSYGISFIGFPAGDEVTGKLMMDNFEIKLNNK